MNAGTEGEGGGIPAICLKKVGLLFKTVPLIVQYSERLLSIKCANVRFKRNVNNNNIITINRIFQSQTIDN